MIKVNNNVYILKNQNQYKKAVKDYLSISEEVDWDTTTYKKAFDYYFRDDNAYPKFYPCNVIFTSNYNFGRWVHFITVRGVDDLEKQISSIQSMIDTMNNLED